ncbi:MAG: cache domain-containing protein [Sporomusaceae bacterium]|nr:cache domain-containing protein [Sporomusaceae bacterium]
MKLDTLSRQFRAWTILLILAPSLLTMAIYAANQVKLAKQQNLELISQRVAFQERLINYWLDERANDILSLSEIESIRQLDYKQFYDMLQSVQHSNKNFDSLSYIDKDGYFRFSTLNRPIQFPQATNQPYYQAALAGQSSISDIVIGRNSGRSIINFSSPIYDHQGQFQGVLLGSVRTQTLENLLRDNWIGKTGEILLVNQAGVMLTEPRYLEQLIESGQVETSAKLKMKLPVENLQLIQLGQTGTASWIDYQGKNVLVAYHALPERGWTLIGSIREEEVMAPLYQQLKIMGIEMLLLLLFIYPIAIWATRQLQQPITWLTEQANRIANDDFRSLRGSDAMNMPQELRLLCQTFIAMSLKIKDTIGLLREKEAQLEEQVEKIQTVNACLEGEISEHQATQNLLYHLNINLENKVLERTYELQDELVLAGRVQKSMLPIAQENDKVKIIPLFEPLNIVSGDFYGYQWSASGDKLHGYLLDVTGHSVAAALHTSAISSLLTETMTKKGDWTLDSLYELNEYLLHYFPDNTFAALLTFTFDFKQHTLSCISGGINYFWTASKTASTMITLPGIYLGIAKNPEFGTITLPLEDDAAFYLMTDGLYESLQGEMNDHCHNFDAAVQKLQDLSKSKPHDDCSALCFAIKSLQKDTQNRQLPNNQQPPDSVYQRKEN